MIRATLLLAAAIPLCAAIVPADLSAVRAGGPVRVEAASQGAALRVTWPDESGRPWTAEFSLDTAQPLLTRVGDAEGAVIEKAQPWYTVETGKRRGGWDQFFDYPPSHPEGTRRFFAAFTPTRAVARSKGDRVELSFEGLRLGIFSGAIAYTFYPGSRLIQQEAVVSTREPDTAFLYDAGFEWTADADRRPGGNMATSITWYDTRGRLQVETLPYGSERHPRQVRYRAMSARTAGGAIAVFPAPHQYFFARDYTTNLGHLWARSWRGKAALGIRQLADENWQFYPWMNAPPDSVQRLSLFLLVSRDSAADALEQVLRFTNRDRFPAVPGYKTLASHWHFAYSGQAAEYGERWVPPFKPVLQDLGIDAAMIADFHGDGHPRDTGALRLAELETYYRMCRAQSGERFLIIPAEEANIHLGGHWVVAFPKPVYWYMAREASQPFVENDSRHGRVYRTADPAETIDMIRREGGLLYTAHPRTKGSLGFPDKYKDTGFFRDPRFLGAGWKQMPSDLSTLRQGLRSLNLLDDMNNWGLPKKLLPEVDVFQLDATHELYAHMNAAYVKMEALPRFDDYGRMLEAVARGDYFASTGEVLLPEVRIARGEVTAGVRWTMPLAHLVIVAGDGSTVRREVVPLEETRPFGTRRITHRLPPGEWRWARIEVWDVAGSGAFTNPVWMR